MKKTNSVEDSSSLLKGSGKHSNQVPKNLGDRRGAEEIDDFRRILYGFRANFYCRRVYIFVCGKAVDVARIWWDKAPLRPV